MLLGPVFSAEMITSSRRTRNLLVRVGYAAVLLVALGLIYLDQAAPQRYSMQTVQRYAQLASRFFATFSILQLIAVVLIAPAIAAGTIASERERRTIEYLFASDLSNAEIVIGKMFASLLRAASFLLVGLPILSLTMLLGGIGPDRLFAVFVATCCTLVAVTALAIAVSVWSPRARLGITRTYFYLAVLLLVPPLLYLVSFPASRTFPNWALTLAKPVFAGGEELLAANPFYVVPYVLRAMAGKSGVSAGQILWPLVRDHGLLAVVCVASALVAVRRVHLKQSARGGRKSRFVRRPPVGRRPVLWKEVWADRGFNTLGRVGNVVLALIVVFVGGLTIWTFSRALRAARPAAEFNFYGMTLASIVECLAILLVGARAAGLIVSEKERDTWVALISTPLSGGEIVVAKWQASILRARPIILGVGPIWLLMLVFDSRFLVGIPFLLLAFLVELAFAASIGTWFSLWCGNSTRALGATVATLLILGGGYLPLGACCAGWLFASFPYDELVFLAFIPCLPFLLAVPNFAVEFFKSWGHLQSETLSMAMTYFVGVVGYAVAAHVLLRRAIDRFDQLAGRTAGPPFRSFRGDRSQGTPSDREATAVA